MTKDNPRIASFIKFVEEHQPHDVIAAFHDELNAALSKGNSPKLAAILERARQGSKLTMALEQGSLRDISLHMNS